jgi:phosphoribosylglycinamide formyltransferase-1
MIISFLASHNGTSAQYLINAIKKNILNATIGVVITNNLNSYIYKWCIKYKIPIYHISILTNPENMNEIIIDILEKYQTNLIILSGYMKKINIKIIKQYQKQIINIHPSLLPKYGGDGMYGNKVHASVLNSSDKISGATVHFINENYDEGEIILQQQVHIDKHDTVESLSKKIKSIEGELYLRSIKNTFRI